MADVAGELADEEEVTLGSQGPGGGGVGLHDGAGEGLVVCIDDQFTALNEVLELHDGGRDSKELASPSIRRSNTGTRGQ